MHIHILVAIRLGLLIRGAYKSNVPLMTLAGACQGAIAKKDVTSASRQQRTGNVNTGPPNVLIRELTASVAAAFTGAISVQGDFPLGRSLMMTREDLMVPDADCCRINWVNS